MPLTHYLGTFCAAAAAGATLGAAAGAAAAGAMAAGAMAAGAMAAGAMAAEDETAADDVGAGADVAGARGAGGGVLGLRDLPSSHTHKHKSVFKEIATHTAFDNTRRVHTTWHACCTSIRHAR